MKAVVLEVRDGLAAVLREDGTVETLPGDYRVGETVELADKAAVVRMPRKAARWAAAAAAALVIVSAGGGYGYNNAYAYSYVTLDANPSIEVVLNRRDRVIAVDALNEDGEALAAELNDAGVRHRSLTDAMDTVTELLYADEYLDGADDSLLVNVSSRGEARRQALTEEVTDYFAGRTAGEGLDVVVTSATRDEARQAEAMGVSPGRYRLIQEIQAVEGPLAAEELDRMGDETVGQLLERSGRREPRGEEAPAEGPGGETAPTADGRPEAGPAEESGDPGGAMTLPDAAPEDRAPDDARDGGTAPEAQPAFDGGGASGEPS